MQRTGFCDRMKYIVKSGAAARLGHTKGEWKMNQKADVGVIGGSGIYSLLDPSEEVLVPTP